MAKIYVAIEQQPLNSQSPFPAIPDPGISGAYVQFEGRIRRFHLGRNVHKIQYDCYRTLALKEMHRILTGAFENFHLDACFAIHRIGELQVGETAVWVGTASCHRKEAFLACESIMDAVKKTVPIWKKEYYTDGTYSWPRCHDHHDHEVTQ